MNAYFGYQSQKEPTWENIKVFINIFSSKAEQ